MHRMIQSAVCLWVLGAAPAPAEEKQESFDRDPGWEGHQNRLGGTRTEEIRQDFGFSPDTHNAGGRPGEVGGLIQPAAEPAYYAKPFPAATLSDGFEASGTLLVEKGKGHFLVGFFNAGTINEWRTPNSLVLRIISRGDFFYAYVDFATAKWRAGGVAFEGPAPPGGRASEEEIPCGVPHAWSLRYDPRSSGALIGTIGHRTAICPVEPELRKDGATVNRFGILTVLKSRDDAGRFWLDDLSLLGKREDFSRDPGWESLGNRTTFRTANIRPLFDFGFSATQHAGGRGQGELGGLVFRGDCRYPERLAAYGDRLEELSLAAPLRASGRVSLHRGVSDSTSLFGFYNSRSSLQVNPSQNSGIPMDFLGIAVEGPSRDGFFFYPLYRVHGEAQGHAGRQANPPQILPDGKAHDWALEYDPAGADSRGRITVKLDGQATRIDLGPGDQAVGARFDRFGIVTTWIDGNAQRLYLDDLTYTVSQEK
jgi:hypothetical protein